MSVTTTQRNAFAVQSSTASRQERVRLLFRRYRQTGDDGARTALIEHFMPLAKRIARRYRGGREPWEDLQQVASLGLVKAVDGYDLERGVSFTSYATPTISGELKRHFRDHGWAVHVPRGAQERALLVQGELRRLLERTGRQPTSAELAELTGLSEAEVESALAAYQA